MGAQDIEVLRLGAQDGLSQGMTVAMSLDADGFAWVGTLNGLNRLDGTRFKTYTHLSSDPYSLSSNAVYGILNDSKGRMWVGLGGELDCYDRKTDRFYHLGNKYSTGDNRVVRAYPWFETPDGHIWLCDNNLVTEIVVPDDFPENPEKIKDIKYVYHDFNDESEVETRALFLSYLPDSTVGIQWNSGRMKRFDKKNKQWLDLAPNALFHTPCASGHEMLYDSIRRGHWLRIKRNLYFVHSNTIQQTYLLPSEFEFSSEAAFEKPLASSSFCDEKGNLWFLHDGNLYRISPPATASASLRIEKLLDKTLEKQVFVKLLRTKQGTVLVGTSGFGLVHIRPKSSLFDTKLKDESVYIIRQIAQDTLSVMMRNLVYTVVSSEGSPEQKVFSSEKDGVINKLKTPDGRIVSRILETQTADFIDIKYPNGQAEVFLLELIHTNRCEPMFVDAQGRLWIANSKGELACLLKDEKKFRYFDFQFLWKKGETNFSPKQMYQSVNGDLWITTTKGLVQITVADVEKPFFKLWQNVPSDPFSLSSNDIQSVVDDPKEPNRYLWVATNGNGINKMDKQTGKCVHLSQKDGLPNNVVYGILADNSGKLWMSTNYGLSCFNPANGNFRNFTVKHGLQHNEFNTYSYFKFPDGRLAFGGVRGLNIFDPSQLLSQAGFPKLFITHLKINNKPIEVRDSSGILDRPIEFMDAVRLKHHQNFLSISFTSVDFSGLSNQPYYYKMDGVDKDWVFINSAIELSYSNLDPGTYTLHVTNVNENGEKNPNEATLTFVIQPPWWRTWAAYIVYALLLGFVAWRGFHFQVNRLKMKNELLYKEKEAKTLQVLDEMKTRFFTNITHEFRTPLTLIIEPARQIAQSSDLALAQTQSRIILNNANRLLLLVNHLLDLSKIEEGKIPVSYAQAELSGILADLVEWFRPVAERKQQILSFSSIDGSTDALIDVSILEKIIYNLLSNAHKFTPVGGVVELLLSQPDAATWEIEVKDTGIGIPPEKLPHIFDRFYQVDNSLTRQNEGSGIGLSLVKELCALMQGQIQVQSEVGKGTSFRMQFPRQPKGGILTQQATQVGVSVSSPHAFDGFLYETVALDSIQKTHADGSTESETILLIEDNAELRSYLHMVLAQENYRVIEAENGMLGLEMALEAVPDLIITDVMMPVMNGYEVTERLKNDRITSHIPVVMLTAKGQHESKMEGYRSGADAYLSKPFHTEELLLRLNRLVESRKRLQEKYQAALPSGSMPPIDGQLSSVPMETVSDMDKEWLAQLEQILREQMTNEAFVFDSLPSMMLMSRTQFYNKVKALTGLTPSALFRNLRLEKAYHLLISSPELSVREVMLEIGLNDSKSFTNQFKERYGQTPKQVSLGK